MHDQGGVGKVEIKVGLAFDGRGVIQGRVHQQIKCVYWVLDFWKYVCYHYRAMRKNDVLTKKQTQIYRFIKNRLFVSGKPPLLREIAQEMGGISLRTVTQHLGALQNKGLILRDRYTKRGISLLENRKLPGEEMIQVPVFASAGCGNPSVIAERAFNEHIMVPPDMTSGKRDDLFVIRAIGESMRDAGVSDGDFVLAQRTENVESGDLVVAIIEDNALIKRIAFADDAVILSPDNKDPQYHPIILRRNNFHIFGKVVRIIKMQKNDDYQIVPINE